jgi:hypothetical protein
VTDALLTRADSADSADSRAPISMALPSDIVSLILVLADTRVKVRLYEAGMLHSMVSAAVYPRLVDEVMLHYRDAHRRNLSRCLEMLPFHVWDDGTPMKRRAPHARFLTPPGVTP